jgi:sugar phosphate isomerase/epimerase
MIALSTCWQYAPDMDLGAWLRTVKDIGFDAVELDYNLTRGHLEALPPLLDRLGLRVSSVHNFCPTPDDAPSPRHKSNYYRLSAIDEAERLKAVAWTCRSIDTAVRFSARAVVIHAGAVDFEDERSTRLRDLFKAGHKGTPEYAAELQRVLTNRKRLAGPHRAAVRASLEAVLAYAQRHGRVLGFESRYYPLEIPNFEEVGLFLEDFYDQGLRYWHDMGHAQMNEKLGITANQRFLQAYHGRMAGVHLHDMKGVKDHQAPFAGELDWDALLPYVRACPLLVFEVKKATAGELADALSRFKQALP